MKMTSEPPKDPLDIFFAASRAEAPQLSPELRARLLAQAVPASVPRAAPPRRWPRLSGWIASAVTGGALAGLAGLWIGTAMPLPLLALELPLWLDDTLLSLPLPDLDSPLWIGH